MTPEDRTYAVEITVRKDPPSRAIGQELLFVGRNVVADRLTVAEAGALVLQLLAIGRGSNRSGTPERELTPARCGAVAHPVCGIFQEVRCDREVGHRGQHRGYVGQFDDNLFWGGPR